MFCEYGTRCRVGERMTESGATHFLLGRNILAFFDLDAEGSFNMGLVTGADTTVIGGGSTAASCRLMGTL